MLFDLTKTLVLLGSSSLLFSACGDDGDGKSAPDAGVTFDAAPPADAAPPDPTFSGTLSLAEVTVTNPQGGGASGGVANISFTDPADVTVAPQPGYTNNIGGCRIFVYDVAAGESPPSGSDGGPVSVTGTENGPFACAYTAAIDTYLCSSTDAAAAGAMTVANTTLTPNVVTMTTANLEITGADFSGANYVGMSIILDGFENANANGRFPILAQPADDTLTIFAPGLGPTPINLTADSAYQTLVGTGPVPGGAEFLDDGSTDVTFTKAAATNAPAIDTTLKANGEGFELAEASELPHAVPTDGSAATFSCAGSCGAVDTTNFLRGIIVFGSTTDANLDDTTFNEMPDPVSSFATFQCSGIGMESITLDEGAMALIMGTNPTRIQTSVTYANAVSGTNNILLSHGVVGFTDVEP